MKFKENILKPNCVQIVTKNAQRLEMITITATKQVPILPSPISMLESEIKPVSKDIQVIEKSYSKKPAYKSLKFKNLLG